MFMIPKRIETTGRYKIVVRIDSYGCAEIAHSDLSSDSYELGELSPMLCGIEAMVCAMAYNGFDISNPKFCYSLDSAVGGCIDKVADSLGLVPRV